MVHAYCLHHNFASIRSDTKNTHDCITGTYYHKILLYLSWLSLIYVDMKFCPYWSANQRFSCSTFMLFKVQVVSPCVFLVEFT